MEGQSFEITTFRKDVATDGRHAEIIFLILRRMPEGAILMNAIYATADGVVIDLLEGLATRAQRIRFINDAGQRIREDYLDFGVFRFSA